MSNKWLVPSPHTHVIKVNNEHIDVLGHVNNCEYLKWMEEVAWSHCEKLNMNFAVWQELGYAWVARHTEIDYLLPAFEHDTIIGGTWITENDKRISMKRDYQFIRESDGKTLITGFTRWVCVNLKTGKACRMPKEFAQSFDVDQPMDL